MASQNIEIGIDLGTTNSEIAVNNNGKIEVIKNIFGDEYTPSVFGIDKAKNKVVGKRAYERLYKDASSEEFKNNKAEVKRLMGMSETVHFTRLDKDFTPEEMSAEILISLREDVLRKVPDFNVQAVVITIPAYFSTLQAEATKRAGNLAGFDHVVLLQEPIAAAMAYGFINSENENWIVYDLGGGTFDVALISSKDGALSVLGHSGDNFLGGKDFDWLVVDRIIVPKLLNNYELKDFNRGNAKYSGVFAKLKYLAENAKISLSQYQKTTIELEGIGSDDNDKEIYLSVDLSRGDFEKIIKPLVDRTIELAQKTIAESGTKKSSIHKVVLVGGPTLIPYIKQRIEEDLKVEADTSVDPLTVVAKGACIFGMSQRVPKDLIKKEKKTSSKVKNISLNYESLTSETEVSLTGSVEGLDDDEYYIQIQSDSGFYSGSKIKLKNGKFLDTIALEPKKTNVFWIYLFDKKGNTITVEPDSFSITQGLSIAGAPIPHSIGVALAKRDSKSGFSFTEGFEPFFEKNSILPLRKTETFHTTKRLKKGDKENALPIKVYEGESDVPDRNTLICELKITGENLPYDLPENTEVELTIDINESREVKIEAFIPNIDLSLDARATIHAENLDVQQMENEFNSQRERVGTVETNCTTDEKSKLEEIVRSITGSLHNASLDEDEKRKANKQLKDLKITLDHLEKSKELPQLIKEFNMGIESAQKAVEDLGDEKDKSMNDDQLKTFKEEGEKAIANSDKNLLSRVIEQINQFKTRVIFSNPSVWVYHFQKLQEGGHHYLNEKEAAYFTDKGRRAIDMGDVDELKRCVHNLMLLLPPDEQKAIKTNFAGISR